MIKQKMQGGATTNAQCTWHQHFCILSHKDARKEYFIPIYQCKIAGGSRCNGEIWLNDQSVLGNLLVLQGKFMTQLPLVMVTFHCSGMLLLQLGHWLLVFVVIYLVATAIYRKILGHFGWCGVSCPNWDCWGGCFQGPSEF